MQSGPLQESKILEFRPVTLEDKELVDRYMKPFGQNSCQHSFINLYTLTEKYGSNICEQDGTLFVLRKSLCTDKTRVYLAPMGGDLKNAYETILADSASHNCLAVFQTVTREHVDFLKSNFPGRFEYVELRDFSEYIYNSDRLCRMSGKKLADKRNKINKIILTYGELLDVRFLTKDSVPEIWKFEQDWFNENAETHDQHALKSEMRAIRLQLDKFEELGIKGIGIYIEGEMVAFAYGIALNENCFDGLIAKATKKIKNLYKLLYREISNMCAEPYKYFNWEEDLGVQGLRDMKMEYAPLALMRKYLVKEKENPSDGEESDEIMVASLIPLKPGEEMLPDDPEKSDII